MLKVAENELQRVRASRQHQRRLGLPAAEMDVLRIHRNGRLGLRIAEPGIDDQMMVSVVRPLDARRRDPHAGEAELALERARDLVAVLQIDEIHGGAGRRRRFRAQDRGCDRGGSCGNDGGSQQNRTAAYGHSILLVGRDGLGLVARIARGAIRGSAVRSRCRLSRIAKGAIRTTLYPGLRFCVSTFNKAGVPERIASKARRSAGINCSGVVTFSPRPPHDAATISKSGDGLSSTSGMVLALAAAPSG